MRGMSLPLFRPALVVREAGNGGPRKLDRQASLDACSHGNTGEYNERGEVRRNGSVKKA
jgi:hypothetical protein